MIDAARLYRMARHLAYTKCLHECPEQIAQDCQQAAWLCYLKEGEHAHIWKNLEYAMLEEISRWNWGCKRGRGKDSVLKLKAPLKEYAPPRYTLDPERLLILKEEIQKMPAVSLAGTTRHRISDPNSNRLRWALYEKR